MLYTLSRRFKYFLVMLENIRCGSSKHVGAHLLVLCILYRFRCLLHTSGPRCDKPLGMKSEAIRSNQITASSELDRNHGSNNARLHWHRSRVRFGAWTTLYNNYYQWIQVHFKVPKRVVKISTQGRDDARQWVTKYYVEFSSDGGNFAEYKEASSRKVCEADSLLW